MSRTGILPLSSLLIALAATAYGQAPAINAGGVVNAADYTPNIAPGTIFSVFGTNLAATVTSAKGLPLPLSLDGVSVEITQGSRTLQAPLFFVSGLQINAQLPHDAGTGTVTVRVKNPSGASAAVSVPVAGAAPRLFTKTMDGKGESIMLHSDYTLVTAAAPARGGEIIMLYLIGLGEVSPAPATGAGAGNGTAGKPLNLVRNPPAVTVGGRSAPVLWAGLAPGFVGLYQLNIRLPEAVVPGMQPIVVSCGDIDSQASVNVPMTSNWDVVSTGAIGAAGGSLSTAGLTVAASQGALPSQSTVTISRYTGADTPEPGRVTPPFLVEGMPAQLGAPVTIEIDVPPSAAANGEVVVALRALDRVGGAPQLARASVANGKASITLPATPSGVPKGASTGSEAAVPDRPGWVIWAIEGYKTAGSANQQFMVFYRDGVTNAQASRLADAFERAYDKLALDVRLQWSRRSPQYWPIEAFVYEFTDSTLNRMSGLTPDTWGAEGDVYPSVQRQNIHLNARFTRTAEEMEMLEITCGHELFHLLQNLYDPRTMAQLKWGSDSPWLWYMEAASTWFERMMANSPGDYLPPSVFVSDRPGPNKSDNYAFLTTGGLGSTNTRNYGYGASMFLQHLSNRYGARSIGDVLKKMAEPATVGTGYASEHLPVDAIRDTLPKPVGDEWKEFARAYMAGTLYGQPGGAARPSAVPEIVSLVQDWYEVRAVDDPGHVFTWESKDLSAKFFGVRFGSTRFSTSTRVFLNLNDGGTGAEMIVYRLTSTGGGQGTWTKLADSGTSFEFTNAAELTAQDRLIVMVPNPRASYPYQGSSQISLSVQTGTDLLPELQKTTDVAATMSSTIVIADTLSGRTTRLMSLGMNSSNQPTRLTWSGASFSWVQSTSRTFGTASETEDISVTGTVDPVKRVVSNVKYARKKTTSQGDGRGELIEEWQMRDLPLSYVSSATYSFSFGWNGAEAQKHVSGIKYTNWQTWAPDKYNYDEHLDRIEWGGEFPDGAVIHFRSDVAR